MAKQGFLLWLQCGTVSCQYKDLVVLVKCNRNHRALHHGGHEYRDRSHITCERLEGHHKTTIPSNADRTLGFQPLDRLHKFLLHGVGHHASLGHLECKPWNAPIQHIIVVAAWTINVSSCWWVIVIKPHNTQHRGLLPCQLFHLLDMLGLGLGLGLGIRCWCLCLVDDRLVVLFGQVLSELVLFLLLVPLSLPIINAKTWIVFIAANVEVCGGDCIPYWQVCRSPQGIRVWRQLRTLEQDGTDLRVVL
mmetsp:Transcript_84481/g.213029  ORF Transcript_84481/g.213029 Transcript_84481/m.213029 type:complete len:248 (+) Transcript_84481:562-1305(+)